jgi:O-antigen/teichoic acid export membrane protein
MTASNSTNAGSLTRQTLHATGWSTLASFGRQAMSLASIAVLARLLGPSAYGLMAMAVIITNFLANFRDLGTASAVVQRVSVSRRMLSSLFWVNLGLGILLCLLVLGVAGTASRFFDKPELKGILQALAFSFCVTAAAAVHSAILKRELAFKKLAVADLGASLVGYIVAISCAAAAMGVWSLVWANLANAVVTTVLVWMFCVWRPSLEFDVGEVRSTTSFSLNLSGFGLVNYFTRNADNLVVGRFLGSEQLGYYQMAYTLMLYPLQNISAVIAQVLIPAFSRIQNDNERFRSAYVRSLMLIGLITFPIMAGLGVVADPFVRAVLGPKWIPVIPVFQILAPVGLVQSVQTTVGQIYVAKARTDWMFRWGLANATVTVAAFLVGVRWGIKGVAIAYFATYFTFTLYSGFAIPFRLIELRFVDFVRQLWPQIAITAAMAAACFAWLFGLGLVAVTNAWVRLISTSIIGLLAYSFLLLLFRPAVVGHFEEVLEQQAHSPLFRGILWVTRLGAKA